MEYPQAFTDILSVKEFHKMYKTPKSTIYRWCNEGFIMATKLAGSRGWIICRHDAIKKMGLPMTQLKIEWRE